MNKAYRRILIAAGMAGLVLSGCQSRENQQVTPAEATVTERTEEKALSDIYKEIEEGVELPKMVVLNDNYIANYFGIDLAGLEEYVFTNAEDHFRYNAG